ncbi:MAG: hypothetical protein U9R19_12725 [Bacteroidota bacterium]|nr:hypothetical protein [Bacteroidota bacterium]
MHKGKSINGREFFDLLFESDEFNTELGKITLAAGKLEAELKMYFTRTEVKEKVSQSTLGQLIKIGKKHDLLDSNLATALEMTCKQRNYLIHNIYALLIDLKAETILERNNLIDSDVHTYLERAWQLKTNLIELAEVISIK